MQRVAEAGGKPRWVLRAVRWANRTSTMARHTALWVLQLGEVGGPSLNSWFCTEAQVKNTSSGRSAVQREARGGVCSLLHLAVCFHPGVAFRRVRVEVQWNMVGALPSATARPESWGFLRGSEAQQAHVYSTQEPARRAGTQAGVAAG